MRKYIDWIGLIFMGALLIGWACWFGTAMKNNKFTKTESGCKP